MCGPTSAGRAIAQGRAYEYSKFLYSDIVYGSWYGRLHHITMLFPRPLDFQLSESRPIDLEQCHRRTMGDLLEHGPR